MPCSVQEFYPIRPVEVSVNKPIVSVHLVYVLRERENGHGIFPWCSRVKGFPSGFCLKYACTEEEHDPLESSVQVWWRQRVNLQWVMVVVGAKSPISDPAVDIEILRTL